MLIVTSFNQSLFDQYGSRMVHEFAEKSDGTVKLAVMYEGETTPDIQLKNIEFIKFHHEEHQEFLRKFGHIHEARGLRITFLPENKVNLAYSFLFDAVRFSFKIFALRQALALYKPDHLFAWMDADVRCIRSFGATQLMPFFPADTQLMSYLGRNKFPLTGAYSECGFLGFNARHPQLENFLRRMSWIYTSGEVFAHDQWHDSWIWDKNRLEFELSGVEFRNISGVAVDSHHPFINSGLGIYFDHLKGPERKQAGRSFAKDYRAPVQ